MQSIKATEQTATSIESYTSEYSSPLSMQEGCFEKKINDIVRLMKDYETTKAGPDAFRSFTELKKETSELFGAALQDKIQRIAIQRQILTSKETELERAEQEESAILRAKNKRAEELLQTVGTCVKQVLQRFTTQKAIQPDEHMQRVITESLRFCSLTLSQPQYRCQLAYAKNLLENKNVTEALKQLEELSVFFPEELKAHYTEIKSFSSKEEPQERLQQFLSENEALLTDKFAEIESTPPPTVTFADLLKHQTIMEAFLKHLSLGEIHTAANSRNFREITAQSFPAEYVNRLIKNIYSARHFSLRTAPKICCECENIAYLAMLRNSQEFELLSETLRQNVTVIKFAIISILMKRSSEKFKKINALFNQVPKNVRKEIEATLDPFIKTASFLIHITPISIGMRKKQDNLAIAVYILRKDEDICTAAIGINGLLAEFVIGSFRENKEFMLKAVRNNGLALKYANPILQKDKYIVSSAVEQNGCALKFAHPDLQDNEEIVSLAVLKDRKALQFASLRLQIDPSMLALISQQTREIEQSKPKKTVPPISVELLQEQYILFKKTTYNGCSIL